MRFARFTVRVFRSFGFLRMIVVVMNEYFGSAGFRMVKRQTIFRKPMP